MFTIIKFSMVLNCRKTTRWNLHKNRMYLVSCTATAEHRRKLFFIYSIMTTQYKSLINVIMIKSVRLENGERITMS